MSKPISIFKNAQKEKKYMAAYDESLKLWPNSYETKYVPTRIGETHVIISGSKDGKPLVLLHGASTSATMWYANVDALGTKYRIYAVDTVTDIGKSKISSLPKTRQDMADWVRELLDGLGIEKPHMMGLSYGGFLTINFAHAYPDLVEKIVLLAPVGALKKLKLMFWIQALSTAFFPFESRIKGLLKWMIQDGNEWNNVFVNQYIMGMKNCTSKISVMPSTFTDEELKRIKTPALIFVGDQEVLIDGTGAVERAKELMPNVQTEIVNHCGHGIAMEQPEFVNGRILEFLS